MINYHGAVLLEIERGHLNWGDNFQVLQNTTLAGGLLSSNFTRGAVAASSAGGGPKRRFGSVEGGNEGILFCRAYQRGSCSHTGDHKGDFKGEIRSLKHICGNCWLLNKKMAAHPETSEVCPFAKSTQQEGS